MAALDAIAQRTMEFNLTKQINTTAVLVKHGSSIISSNSNGVSLDSGIYQTM